MDASGIIQTVAVAVSALGVGASIIWNRIITRRAATIKMLLDDQSNVFLLNIRKGYLDAVRTEKLLEYSSIEKWYSEESFPFVSVLNRYEIIAIAINEGAIDQGIYMRYFRTGLVGDWIRCKRAVLLQRKNRNNNQLFLEFEALARRWATLEERVSMDALDEPAAT